MKPPATRSRSADVSTIHLADLLPPRQKTQMQRYRDLSSSLGPFNFRNIVLFSRTARSSVRTTHKRSRTRLSLRGFAIEHLVTGVTAERAYAFCEVDLIPQLAPIAGRKAPFFARVAAQWQSRKEIVAVYEVDEIIGNLARELALRKNAEWESST